MGLWDSCPGLVPGSKYGPIPVSLEGLINTNFQLKSDMQKVTTTRPLFVEIFSDCGRIKTGSPLNLWKCSTLIHEWPFFCMLTMKIHQLMFQKGLIQPNFFWNDAYISDFFKNLLDANYALLRKFLKIQILAAEGFKLSACLTYPRSSDLPPHTAPDF